MTDTDSATTAARPPVDAFRTAVHEVTVVFTDETRQTARYATHELALQSAERIAAGTLPDRVAKVAKPINRVLAETRQAIYPALTSAAPKPDRGL